MKDFLLNSHAQHGTIAVLPHLGLPSLLGHFHVFVKLREYVFPKTRWNTLEFYYLTSRSQLGLHFLVLQLFREILSLIK